jgi:hypothetical protein
MVADDVPLVFYYYYEFEKKPDHYEIRLAKQKMEWDLQAFEVQEIYGIANTGLIENYQQGQDELADA